MSAEFISALQMERERLAPVAEAAELPAARLAMSDAQEQLAEELAAHEARNHGRHAPSSPLLNMLRTTTDVAHKRVTELERSQGRAQARIKEIDRLLTSSDDAKRARNDLADANANAAEAKRKVNQLAAIATTVESEIAALAQNRCGEVEHNAKHALAARLAGKVPPSLNGTLGAIDGELESRRETLRLTKAALTEAKALLKRLLEDVTVAGNRLNNAEMRRDELEWHAIVLPQAIPLAARLAVRGSPLCNGRVVEIYCDDEVIDATRDALHHEFEADA